MRPRANRSASAMRISSGRTLRVSLLTSLVFILKAAGGWTTWGSTYDNPVYEEVDNPAHRFSKLEIDAGMYPTW